MQKDLSQNVGFLSQNVGLLNFMLQRSCKLVLSQKLKSSDGFLW